MHLLSQQATHLCAFLAPATHTPWHPYQHSHPHHDRRPRMLTNTPTANPQTAPLMHLYIEFPCGATTLGARKPPSKICQPRTASQPHSASPCC